MEIKVTIALDEKAHDVLNRLIAALGGKSTVPTVTVEDNSAEEWTEEEIREVMEAEAAEIAADAVESNVRRERAADGEVAAPKPETKNTPASDGVSASPKITLEDLRALAADVKTKTGDIGKVKALLTEYSAKNISALPEDKWDEFADKLKELL